ncbi:hypothetical protein IGL04_001210 [Enterococcus sp. AZ085]|uniref:hypothetical protein n=1 Tax=unclassified Enterococcus TaxID=2608891 RepID=UPI003F1E62F5
MKKFIVLLAALSSMIVMTGCQSPTTTEQSSAQSQATTKKSDHHFARRGKRTIGKKRYLPTKSDLVGITKKTVFSERRQWFCDGN